MHLGTRAQQQGCGESSVQERSLDSGVCVCVRTKVMCSLPDNMSI